MDPTPLPKWKKNTLLKEADQVNLNEEKIMFSLFQESERKEKMAAVREMNAELQENLDQLFAKNYPAMRAELLESGVPEETVDEKLQAIKQDVQREMLLKAKQVLKEKIRTFAKEHTTQTNKEASH